MSRSHANENMNMIRHAVYLKHFMFVFPDDAGDVLMNGNTIKGVAFETKSGPIVIHARVIVDGTGDGDVAARAGAAYEIGREEEVLWCCEIPGSAAS